MFIIAIFQVFLCLSIVGSPVPVVETRTHNAANELQGIVTYDANGGVLTKSFYNENWQEVESVTGSQMTSYVWGLRYIGDLILREKGEERLYSLADPNWNVIAIVDASGAAVERVKYDAFGKTTWLDASFGAKTASGYGWNRTFTGQVLDSETGLMLYRERYYSTLLGRFVNRDPIGYNSNDINLYRYVENKPIRFTDPVGNSILGLDISDVSVSATYNFPAIPIPNPFIPSLTIACSITVEAGLSKCCKQCKEYEFSHATISGSCAGQIGKAMQKPEYITDEKGTIRRTTPKGKSPGNYENSSWGGGGSGAAGNGGCPAKSGWNLCIRFCEWTDRNRGCRRTVFSSKKIGSIREGFSGIFNDVSGSIGYKYGVYGAFVSLGAEISGEWTSSISGTGNDCNGNPLPSNSTYYPPTIKPL